MSYAIIQTGGKQFRVSEGKEVRVPLMKKETGEMVEFTPLLLVAEGGIGTGWVQCRVVAHGRAKKVLVFKFKRRKQYSRQKGHRQDFTTLKVEKIGSGAKEA